MHLHNFHQWVVAALQKLDTEVLQDQAYAVSREALLRKVSDRPAKLVDPSWSLLHIIRMIL